MGKKKTQREPLKGEISLLEWAEGLTTFKISGRVVGRLSHKGKPCEYCGCHERKLHHIGCKLEISPCNVEEHEYAWDCNCPIEGDE